MVQCKEGILFFILAWWLGILIADGERGATRSIAGGGGNNINNNNNTTDIPFKQIGIDVHGLPVNMPLVGAGTWQYNDTIAYQSLCKAFSAGITFVDTAMGYKNQMGVGKAVRDCWQGKRQDLFVM